MLALYAATRTDHSTFDGGGNSDNEQRALLAYISDFPPLPAGDPQSQYDNSGIAIGALATVAEALLHDASPTPMRSTTSAVHSLRSTQSRLHLQRIGRDLLAPSLALGDAIGEAIVTWAANDGIGEVRSRMFEVPTGDEAYWRGQEPPIQPYWGGHRPFLIQEMQQCTVPLRLPFTTFPGTTMQLQAMEVYTFGKEMSAAQAEIAAFWGEEMGGEIEGNHARIYEGNSATHWLLLAAHLMQQRMQQQYAAQASPRQTHNNVKANDLATAADLYARIALVLADTTIIGWQQSYQTFRLRPQSYINRYIDADWEPYLLTPPLPSYPSIDAAIGSAAAEILTAHFGTQDFADPFGVVRGEAVTRRYTTFGAAAHENAMAALYGGKHFRVDIEAGLRIGACMGSMHYTMFE